MHAHVASEHGHEGAVRALLEVWGGKAARMKDEEWIDAAHLGRQGRKAVLGEEHRQLCLVVVPLPIPN